MATSSLSGSLERTLAYPATRPLPLRLLALVGRFARRKPLGFAGLLIVLAFVLMALFAPVLAPYPPNKTDRRHGLEGPSARHLLGTDKTGRDVLSRLIYGARISITVGFGAVALSAAGAALVGTVSGYLGGWPDKIIQRFVDAWQSMPGLIILITFLGIVRRLPDVNMLLAMILAIGVLGIAGTSRVIRSAVLVIKASPYIEAARSTGATGRRIVLVHILPNVFPLILVGATVSLGGVILAEASLSFLGFGPAGEPSWGQMLSTDGRDYMRAYPGLAIFPGLCIALAVFGFNIFGDALRDVLDPRLRQGGRR
jgi:peptide/nickel transport system permease protein